MIDLKARNRQALKALRERRGSELETLHARLKEQLRIEKELTRLLREGPRTVPTLAETMGLPSQAVFWHLMALKKYGRVVEADRDGDYFQYRLVSET